MVITLNVSSQSQLELNVFEKINDYRVENGLKELKWDDDTYKSTRIHTVYMINEGELSHTENSKTPRFTDRLMVFQDNNYILGNENVSAVAINNIENSIEGISEKIFYSWKISKGHNKSMLNKGATVGAISCGDGVKIKDNYTLKIKYSTFVLWVKPL